METIRGILAAHSSGISKPGLLAWARLRIDAAMTEAQLDEELARLGDEVIDEQGFLYLRSTRGTSAPSAWAPDDGQGPSSEPGAPDAGRWLDTAARDAGAWTPPRAARRGIGGIGKVIGVGIFLWWIVGLVGGLVGGRAEPAAAPVPTWAPTPTLGSVISYHEIALGDCLVVPTEDEFSEIRRVPCDTPHGGEVFLVADHPDGGYPSDEAFGSYVDAACRPAFGTWTGSQLDEQDLLAFSWFVPTDESWADGYRTFECYLSPADGTLAEQSYRAANP